jgi:hypothetical protein
MNSNHLDRQPQPTISDEMLSAYLDGEVTPQERLQIERAAAQDADTAWRLASLQQTVALVKALPRVSLPRSFTLSEADVAPPRAAAFAPWWRALFDPILLRNATAMTAVLFLALLVGDLAPRLISPAAAPAARLFKETVVVEEYTTPTHPAVMAQAMAPQPTPTWEVTPAAAVGAPAPTSGETREAAMPAPTPTSEIPPAAAMPMPTPTTTPSAVLSSPGSSGEAEATPPLPEAPPAAASGPLVTTVPAVTAPALELVAPASAPTDGAAKDVASQTNAATPGPNWLRIAQVLLALLTGGLFVAWRRALSPTR